MSPRLRLLSAVLLLLLAAHGWRLSRRDRGPAPDDWSLPASLREPSPPGPRSDLFQYGSAPAPARRPPAAEASKARPTPTPVPADPAAAAGAAPWRLLGVVLRGGARSALLQPGADGAAVAAAAGQALDAEWTLELVHDDSAVLRRADGSRLRLPLLGAP